MRMTGKRFAVLMLALATVLVFALALPAAAETGEFGDVEEVACYSEAVRVVLPGEGADERRFRYAV